MPILDAAANKEAVETPEEQEEVLRDPVLFLGSNDLFGGAAALAVPDGQVLNEWHCRQVIKIVSEVANDVASTLHLPEGPE